MCVAQTAKRFRKKIKIDPRYSGWRKSAAARAKRQALAVANEKARLGRKAAAGRK